jgi:Fe2+ or Zn2+ uptake regulation protein
MDRDMKKQLRMTHQREIIIDELKRCRTHPTADDLYERVRRKLPRISLATVYRNLEILSEAGIIRKIEISGRQKRFDWELSAHDHIYCVQCHRVDNVDLDTQEVQLTPQDSKGYKVAGCRIEFFGLCPSCRKSLKVQDKGERKMACKSKCGTTELSEKQREVLQALAQCKDACSSKDIASSTSLEPKQVSCQITALKKKGFIDSPVRCKYEITSDGRNALS